MTIATNKTEVVRLRVTPEEAAALRRFATEHNCSVSAAIRWLVHQHVIGDRSDTALQNAIASGNGVAKVTDAVEHPAHYNAIAGVECIDVVQHFDFCTGNAIKYLWRAGLKPGADRIEDLRKAAWYVQRAIAMAEQENANGCK